MNAQGQKVALIVIDPQNDFCSEKGALYVSGANMDNIRLASWMFKNKSEIDQIFVTLDTHHILDISHPKFWVNKEGVNPNSFTIITPKDVIDGTWKTTYPFFNEGVVLTYLEKLEEQGEFPHCIWPEHCIIGTWGQAVDDSINNGLREWIMAGKDARFVSYISKGTHPMTEHFGAFKAQVAVKGAPDTEINIRLIEHLNNFDVIYLAGQAKSHCVANSLKQIMDLSEPTAKKFVILEDTMSPVTGFETIADPIFDRAKEMGIKFEKTSD
jgi:nicotinamidase-related amidase